MRMPQYVSDLMPKAKPFRFTKARSMSLKAERREASSSAAPMWRDTRGREERSWALAEVASRVRTRIDVN